MNQTMGKQQHVARANLLFCLIACERTWLYPAGNVHAAGHTVLSRTQEIRSLAILTPL